MKNYGIKVSKPGHDVHFLDANNENPNLSFSSKYDVLKIAKMDSGTFNSGSSATIAHGLGEPKAFIVYLSTDNVNWSIYDGRSYIDSTNLVITKDRGVTTNYYYPSSDNDMGRKFGSYWFNNECGVGKSTDTLTYDYGAIRFLGVSETASIDSASIGFYIDYPSPRGGTVQVKTYGFDEDNTSDVSGDPGGRTRTTAYIQNSCDNGITQVWEFGVTNIFQEIASRGGWSSGNAMGFILTDNGNTTAGQYIRGSYNNGTYLKVIKTAPAQTIYYKYVIFTNKLDSSKTI
jgi:hypothetical protein